MPQNVSPDEDCWRAALWVLDTLLPTERLKDLEAAPLRRRKMAEVLHSLVSSRGTGAIELQEDIAPGAPFLFCLLWWVEHRGIEDESLNRWQTMRNAAGARLEAAAGSPKRAYSLLRSFARARVAVPDQAFSERQIRTVIVQKLVYAGRKIR